MIEVKGTEQLAGMDTDGLKQWKYKLLSERAALTRSLEEAGSPIGRRILERKQEERMVVLEEYKSIQIKGKPAADVVLDLLLIQSRELFLQADIARMTAGLSEKNLEGIDSQVKMCDDAITAKEESTKTR